MRYSKVNWKDGKQSMNSISLLLSLLSNYLNMYALSKRSSAEKIMNKTVLLIMHF